MIDDIPRNINQITCMCSQHWLWSPQLLEVLTLMAHKAVEL